MLDSLNQTVTGGNGNILAGGDVFIDKLINKEIHIEIYEADIKKTIERFAKHMELFERDINDVNDSEGKYDFTKKEEKNRLNNLSAEYFEIIKELWLPYFSKIDLFLKSSQNEKLAKQYRDSSSILKTWIAINRNRFNTFEEVILYVAEKLKNDLSKDEMLDSLVILVVLHYMYWNCEIGKRE